ncbi:ferredoxin [Methylobacterium durans]|uniref:Ferredoxin n=1 Tax=Methylobacterium durans TaxID=2202825 RepID=A0A2U8WA43_9HYPH|nr:ferredoxin [Methylobacterium durans]AWN43015.1 ferredoxin [Methylobacterium durans]MEA1833099.1 ferredoxin [Methylobacterium durans]
MPETAPDPVPDSRAGALRVSVDLNRCQAYAQCCYAAPRHFRIEGREALFYDPAPAAADREAIEQARIACPVQAIHVEVIRAEDPERSAP